MAEEENYFLRELQAHYSAQGKKLSAEVLQALAKPLSDLSDKERQTYNDLILPARENIKQALIACLKRPGVSEEEWREQLLFYSGTVIGEIVEEVLNEPRDTAKTYVEGGRPASRAMLAQPGGGEAEKQDEARGSKWRRFGKLAIIFGGSALLIAAALIITLVLLRNGKSDETEVAEDTVEEQIEETTTTAAEDETPSIPGAAGTVFYVKGGDIYAYDVVDNEQRMILKMESIESISASPLGDKIAFYKEGDSIPWVTNIDGTGVRSLLDSSGLSSNHVGEVTAYGLKWSNDGSNIFFTTGGGSSGAMIYQANGDGTGISSFNKVSYPVFAFSTWGGPVVCYAREPTTGLGDWDYRLERIDSNGVITRIEPYVTWNAFWLSHDGSKLAIVEGDYDKKQNLRIHYIDSVRSVMLNEVYDFSIEASWSPDDKFLAICFGEEPKRSMQIYDIESGKLTTILSNEDCWSPSWTR